MLVLGGLGTQDQHGVSAFAIGFLWTAIAILTPPTPVVPDLVELTATFTRSVTLEATFTRTVNLTVER